MNYLCKLISRNIGIINKLKYFFPYNIYNAFILPYISYGILAWGNTSTCLLNRIFVLQKKALRIIDRVDFRAHSDPLFFNHYTLKVNDIYALQLGIFMHQLLAHDLPSSVERMFNSNTAIHQHHIHQTVQGFSYPIHMHCSSK